MNQFSREAGISFKVTPQILGYGIISRKEITGIPPKYLTEMFTEVLGVITVNSSIICNRSRVIQLVCTPTENTAYSNEVAKPL